MLQCLCKRKSAVNALPDFTVVGDVLQIRTISTEPSQMLMIWDELQKKRIECAIMIKSCGSGKLKE